MKIIYLVGAVSFLFFIDCSSTYRITDFPSEEKFYDDFNKSAKDKSLNIILSNDSTLAADNGAMILNDSLSISILIQKTEKISRDEIKDIKYSGSEMSNLSAVILLKNGLEATAGNVNILSDSIINVTIFENEKEYISLVHIREISYKNHWLGLAGGILSGIPLGLIVGLSIYELSTQSNTYNASRAIPTWLSIGFVGGCIWGWLKGYTYTYVFSP